MNPLKLRGSLGNRFSAGGANDIDRLRYAYSRSYQRPSRNQCRSTKALTAMDGDIPALLKRLHDVLQQQEGIRR